MTVTPGFSSCKSRQGLPRRARSVRIRTTSNLPQPVRENRVAMATHPELTGQLGRYRILSSLGAGGMGAVYLAQDTHLDRRVALKVPHFKPDDPPAVIERFQREARIAARIDHPNL